MEGKETHTSNVSSAMWAVAKWIGGTVVVTGICVSIMLFAFRTSIDNLQKRLDETNVKIGGLQAKIEAREDQIKKLDEQILPLVNAAKYFDTDAKRDRAVAVLTFLQNSPSAESMIQDQEQAKKDIAWLRHDADGLGMICYHLTSTLTGLDPNREASHIKPTYVRISRWVSDIGNRGGYFDNSVSRLREPPR